MALTRVFTSFDYDHDENLKILLVGQSRLQDSPFSLADWSVKEPFMGDWKTKVRDRMLKCDQVIILCGQYMASATGVDSELKIAQEENIPYFLLAGYSDKNCTKPKSAKESDKMYSWTWDNLKALIGGAR